MARIAMKRIFQTTLIGLGIAGLVLVAFLPAVGNYYMAEALAKGGSVPWAYVGCAALAALPAVLVFLLLGIHFINGRDVL